MINFLSRLMALFLLLVPFVTQAQVFGPQLTYHGRILDTAAANAPVTGNVQFLIQVVHPDVPTCVLYQETQTQNLTAADGNFTLTVNGGSSTLPAALLNPFSDIFITDSTRTINCINGGTVPGTVNSRRLNVFFVPPGGSAYEPLPSQAINYVPLAIEALNTNAVGGFGATSLLRVVEINGFGVPVPYAVPAITRPLYEELDLTIKGQSSYYVTSQGTVARFSVPLAGEVTGAQSATVVSRIMGRPVNPAGGTYVGGEVMYFDGTNWISKPGLAGTVKTVSSSNNYLTVSGGPPSFNATIDPLLTLNVGTVANTVAAGDDPRIVGAFQASTPFIGDVTGTVSATVVSTVGGKTAAQISQSVSDTLAATSANTASTIVKRDGSGNVTVNTLSATNTSTRNLLLYNAGNTQYATITAPAALAVSYTLTLPTTMPVSGFVLATDASGNTSWISPTTGNVTNVSATAPLSSTGGQTPTISITRASTAVDGYLAASDFVTFNNKITSVTVTTPLTLGGTSLTPVIGLQNSGITPGTYTKVIVDSKGIVTSGTTLIASDIPNLDASKITTGTFPIARGGTGASSLTGNGFVAVDASGSALTSTACAANEVPFFNGTTWTCKLAASNNSSATIVMRDANGDFTARNITTVQNMTVQANLRVQNGGGNYIGITTPIATPNYDIILPNNTVAPTVGQVLAVASGSTGTLIATTWVNSLTDMLTSGYIYVGNASGSATGMPLTGDATISNTGVLTLASVGAGVTSGTQYTKVTVDGKGRVISGAQLASSDVVTALGYTPADDAVSGTYLRKANNLSDLTSSATARNNLGLGTFATANTVDLGSASATGIIADARLQNFANVTSGTQYTKVTVDGKGRVTSGAQLASSDVTTALGYTPTNLVSAAAPLAITGGASNPVISLNTSGVTSGTYPKVSVDIWGRVTSGSNLNNADVVTGLGFTPVNKAGDTMTGELTVPSLVASTTVGIGTASVTAGAMLEVSSTSKGLLIPRMTTAQRNAIVSGAAQNGLQIYNTTLGSLEYYDSGVSAWKTVVTNFSAMTSLNGSTSSTQTIATGSAGTSFNVVTANGVHTFNIPMAASAGVTQGALSNTQYQSFVDKVTSVSGAAGQIVITGGVSSPVVGLANSGVTSGTYGSATAVPSFSVDAFGRITLAGSQAYADATGASKGIVQIGSNITVTTGTISITSGNIITALGYTPVNKAGDTMTGELTVPSLVASTTVGIGTASVTAGAMLEVSSTTKGILIPRMTTAQRNAIASGAAQNGLQIYNTTLGALEYYDSAAATWKTVVTNFSAITSMNGASNSTQTFTTGSAGTSFNIVTNTGTGVHTFNIPMAATAGVTQGALSNTQYQSFVDKVTTVSGAAGQIVITGGVSSPVVGLANSGITAGTFGSSSTIPVVTYDVYGRATGVTSSSLRLASTTETGVVQVGNNISVTAGTISITSGNVIAALGNALSGDVTGSLSATVVATVGGRTASQVTTTVDAVASATSANSSGTIVRRDANGNFTANNITTVQDMTVQRYLRIQNGPVGNSIGIFTPISPVSYDIILPDNSVVPPAGYGLGIQSATSATVQTTWVPMMSASIASGTFYVGNASGVATAVLMSGDTTMSNTGAVTLASVGAGVTSGTQYTKVTVDGKGRVTSGAQLASADIVTALGYTPSGIVSTVAPLTLTGTASTSVIGLANSGVTSGTYGSATAVPSFSVDAFGRITLAGSQAYADATGASKGIVQIGSNITVTTGTISITSGNIITALGYTPVNKAGDTMTGALTTPSLVASNTIGIGTAANNAAAILDIVSTTKGILIPRMTTVQRDAIVSGATQDGLQIYNTSNKAIEYYDANAATWKTVATNFSALTSLNGSVSSTQFFSTGSAGTSFNVVTNNGTHTFNIPMAATAGVTQGALTNTQYQSFVDKVTSVSGAAGQIVITGGVSSPVVGLANSGVTSGTYGSATAVPSFSVDAFGRITLAGSQAYADATGASKGIVQIGSNITVTTGTISITSGNIITALGYAPVSSSIVTGYLQAANNLSDLASSATARTNLGLGTLAVANSIDLGSASATGIIADARLMNVTGVTSGTQYTKVTVDGKGRVTSGAQLNNADVVAGLGFSPMATVSATPQLVITGTTSNPVIGLANSGVTSGTYGSATAVPSFSVDAFGRITLAGSQAYADATGASKGIVQIGSNITVTTGTISITSGNIITALGYAPVSSSIVTGYLQAANNLSDLASSATARTNLGLGTLAVANSIDLGSASATGIIADARLMNVTGVTSGTQYTKVTVDGKGRVTSGAQLNYTDVVTALAYTPMATVSATPQLVITGPASGPVIGLANSGVTSGTYGSATAVPSFSVDAFGRITLAGSQAYADATSVTKGIVQIGSNITVAAGVISISNTDVMNAFGVQAARTFYAGPLSGGSASSTFRTIASSDLPTSGATGVWLNGGNSFGTTTTLGTMDNQSLALRTSGTTRISINTTGSVSFTGQANANISNAGTLAGATGTIDANNGNIMRFVSDSGTTSQTITVNNVMPGSAYTMVVTANDAGDTGAMALDCRDSSGAALPASYIPANGSKIVTGTLRKSVYTFISDGTNCLVTWITGF